MGFITEQLDAIQEEEDDSERIKNFPPNLSFDFKQSPIKIVP